MTDESYFNLLYLNDHELTAQNHDDLLNGLKDSAVETTHMLVDPGRSGGQAPNDALAGGMRIAATDFRDGFMFVPGAPIVANAVKAEMDILRSRLAGAGADRIGKVAGADACSREAAIAIKDTIAARRAPARPDTRHDILILASVTRANRLTAAGRARISAMPA